MTAYQDDNDEWPTGELERIEVIRLRSVANGVAIELGMTPVRDERAFLEITLPMAYFTALEPTPTGTIYQGVDGDLSLETVRVLSTEQSFSDLFVELTRPSAGREISYENLSVSRFVVASKSGDRFRYCTFVPTSSASVGFCADWSAAVGDEGGRIATYAASNFAISDAPIEDTPPPEKPPSSTANAQPDEGLARFGPFAVFPDRYDLIALVGEIGVDAPYQFTRALFARPEAKTILLQSPGGMVLPALQVAHRIRDRSLATVIPEGLECYSACSFLFFAGVTRWAAGTLGVHQVWNDDNNLQDGSIILSDVLEALDEFGVHQQVVSIMLRTLPGDMHVFSAQEIASWSINTEPPPNLAYSEAVGVRP